MIVRRSLRARQLLEAETLRELARRASDVVLILDADARLQYVSPSAERLMGYREADWVGRNVLEVVHADDVELAAGAFTRAIARPGVNEPLELRVRQVGESWRWFEVVATNLLDLPAIRGVVIAARDITDRIEAHTARQHSDDRLHALLEHAGDVVAVITPDAELSYISAAAPALFGYPYGTNIGLRVLDLVHPDDMDRVVEALAARLGTQDKREPLPLRIAHADGSWRHVELVATNHVDNPAINGIVINVRDVTDLSLAQRDAAANARRFEATLANLSDLVSVIDAHGTLMHVSRAGARLVGRSVDERIGANIFDYVHPDDAEFAAAKLAEAVASPGLHGPFETRLRHEDGTYRIFEVLANNLLDDPDVRGIIVNSRDVTDRVSAERALHDSERLYRTIVETAEEGIWMIDAAGITTFVNGRMAEMLGTTTEAAVGRDMWDFIDDDDRRTAEQNLERRRAGIAERHDFKFRRSDGTTFWTMLSASPMTDDDGAYRGAIALVTDISDRRRAEAELRTAELEHHRQQAEIERHQLEARLAQAHRLESLGRLAGGVAHDFNNLNGVILNYAAAIAKQLDPASTAAADLEQIQRAAEQATALTRKLLIFGRVDRGRPEVLDINDIVAETTQLVDRPFGPEITLMTDLSPNRCLTQVDRSQLEQLLMNLLVNARDALPAGGTISVSTEYAAPSKDDMAGSAVVLTVSDNGIGMSPDILRRAFEPFFTTKLPEHGSGLGLATVHAIVTGAGGHVTMDSHLNGGTTVTVRLPGDCAISPTDDANTSPACDVNEP